MTERRITKIGEEVRLRPERFPSGASGIDSSTKKEAKFRVLHFDASKQIAFISFPKEWGGGTQEHLGITETGQYVSTAEDKNNLIPANSLFPIGSKVQLSDFYFKDAKNLILAADPSEEFEVVGYYNDFAEPTKAGQYIIAVSQSRGGNRDHKASPVYGVRLDEKYLQVSTRGEKKKSVVKSATSEKETLELKKEIENLQSEVQKLTEVVKTTVKASSDSNSKIESLLQETKKKIEQSNSQNLKTELKTSETKEQFIQKEEENMSTTAVSSSDKWNSRVQEAGIRTGVKKFQELTRNAISNYLRGYLKADKTVKRKPSEINNIVSGVEQFLLTPAGEMIFCLLLGMALEKGLDIGIEKGMLPKDPNSKLTFYLQKIEEELLISGTATGMETMLDFAMNMFPQVQDMIGSLPDLPVVAPVSKKEMKEVQEQVQLQEVITLTEARG
jgi:hypothetical protein